MRKIIVAICLLGAFALQAQEAVDSTIYQVVEQMPRFPGCEQLDTTTVVKYQCSQASLLNFIYQNVRYPEAARQAGIQGTVVLTFVVEKDGTISQLDTIKNIGGGCAEEAMRVVGAMNEIGIRWVPGIKNGDSVRVQMNLPVRFKLEDPLPYVMVGADTVYVEFDTLGLLRYSEGEAELQKFLETNLTYPAVEEDTCYVGDMDVKLLVQPDGIVKVIEVSDFNNLGFDFQFEAIQLATKTSGKWTPAVYQGRTVPAAYDVSVSFYPENEACQTTVDNYLKAVTLSEEGAALYNEGKVEEALTRLDEAIELFPAQANFRYLRGQIYLNENRLEEACADLKIVRDILATSYVDELLPLICK